MEPEGLRSVGKETNKEQTSLHRGNLVDHFKISRLIGRGGMGEVYLARDIRLGRKVALKVVRTEGLGRGNRRELLRFLQEARVTARFNHPHIVTIYYVGVHKGCPYLALEYLDGHTLRRRLRDEVLSTNEVVRLGLAIADALTEAHRHGVLHRDLKPGNVMLPKDGRLRVLDFGVAKPVGESPDRPSDEPPSPPSGESGNGPLSYDTPAGGVAGTPRYMAPEQWQAKACTSATDVWALGVILHEMLTGVGPFESPTFDEIRAQVCSDFEAPRVEGINDLPPVLTSLIKRCLEKHPNQRPSAEEVAEELRQLLVPERIRRTAESSPFRGLLPFGEQHANLFFGRDAEIAVFLERLRDEPVLAVVGPSGAGKSSFVQAGVVPRLREQARWQMLRLRPGARPFETLAAQILRLESGDAESRLGSKVTHATKPDLPAVQDSRSDEPEEEGERSPDTPLGGNDERSLRDRLYDSPELLSVVLGELAEAGSCRVLLFVDQLEELYVQNDDDEIRRRFMHAICSAADDPLGPVRVVFTLRDDFLGRVAETAIARKALGHIVVLRSPEPDSLKETLFKPLEIVGYSFEDSELPGEMVEAVNDEAACLPLLQFSCTRLWQLRDKGRRLLTRSSYEEMGGVEGALARHADSVLEGLSASQTRAAREIFLRLVTPEGTRRVISMRRLLDGMDENAREVLQRLTQARAIVARKSKSDDDSRAELELVHESLITSWKRLARWMEESREEVAFLDEVGQAAELWEKRGKQREELWRGAPLQEALLRRARCTSVPDPVQRFLKASENRDQQRSRRRRALVAGVIIALASIAVVLSVMVSEASLQRRLAETQRERAELQRTRALLQRAEAQREGARGAFDRGALLEARAKLRGSLETSDSPLSRALWWRLRQQPGLWTKWLDAYLYGVDLSPDGETVAVASSSKSIYLLDVRTLDIRVLRGHEDHVFSVAFSPDGKRLAAGSWGRLVLWKLDGSVERVFEGHEGPVRSVDFSTDGRFVASGGSDHTVRLWTVEGEGEPQVLRGHEDRVRAVSFAPEGDLLASAGADGTVRLWSTTDPDAPSRALAGHAKQVSDVSFSPDGHFLVSASQDHTVRVWNASDGTVEKTLRGHRGPVTSLAFSRGGKLLATGGEDQIVRLWDGETWEEKGVFEGHSSTITGLSFGPAGRYLVSSAYDETVRRWDTTITGAAQPSGSHTGAVHGLSFSPDDSTLASGGFDNTILLWDVQTGRPRKVLRGHTSPVVGVDYSPDGQRLASASFDKTIRLWDLTASGRDRVLWGHGQRVWVVRFSPDGETLASISSDETIGLWDATTGFRSATLEGSRHPGLGVSFDPSGKLLALGYDDGAVKTWDLAKKLPARVFRGHKGCSVAAAFGAEGQLLASSGCDGTVRLWDLRDNTGRALGKIDGRTYGLDFHPDGQRVGVGCSNHEGRIYQVTGEAPLLLRGHVNEVNDLRFNHAGNLAATSSDDGTVRLWEVDTGRPVWRAPALLSSPLELATHNGWISLEDGDSEPRPGGDREWRAAIEGRARSVSQAEEGGHLCIGTEASELEAWYSDDDRRVYRRELVDLREVVALPGGCLALASDGVSLHPLEGERRHLAEEASALAWTGDRIHVAANDAVQVFSPDEELSNAHEVGPGVSAIVRTEKALVIGFRDGSIELFPTSRGEVMERRARLPLEGSPASAVVRLREGPAGSLVVGFANGLFGIWSLETGARLHEVQLHGSVVHLVLHDQRLYAASELGQYAVLDLEVFYRDYCTLLREVWSTVPVVWAQGRPRRRAPPAHHRCADRP